VSDRRALNKSHQLDKPTDIQTLPTILTTTLGLSPRVGTCQQPATNYNSIDFGINVPFGHRRKDRNIIIDATDAVVINEWFVVTELDN